MAPIILLPLVYLAAVLQTWLGLRWEISGAGPDLLALTAFAWLVSCGGPRGFVATALIGLVGDLNGYGPLGPGLAIYCAVGYGVLGLRRRINVDRLPAQWGVLWLAVAAVTAAENVAALCLRQEILSLKMLVERTALVGLYTSLAGAPVLLFLQWRRSQREAAHDMAAALLSSS